MERGMSTKSVWMLKSLPLPISMSQCCLGSWEHSLHGLDSGTTWCFIPNSSFLCSQKALMAEGSIMVMCLSAAISPCSWVSSSHGVKAVHVFSLSFSAASLVCPYHPSTEFQPANSHSLPARNSTANSAMFISLRYTSLLLKMQIAAQK